MTHSPAGPADARPTDLSPLGVARTAFVHLTTCPDPLSLDTHPYPGLPDHPVALHDLRTLLLSQSCPPATRNAVWREMVTRSRFRSGTSGGDWTIGCVGLALPALTNLAAHLSQRFAGDRSDVHAEILRGFLTALAEIDLDRPAIMTRLRWAAYRAGHAAVRGALDAPMPSGGAFESRAHRALSGHPDLVLARAVTASVITVEEADMIGATRLERIRLRVWAAEHGAQYEAARKARQRAEQRLTVWLRDEMSTGESISGRSADTRPLAQPTDKALTAGATRKLRLVTPTAETTPAELPAIPEQPGMSRIGDPGGVQGCDTTPHLSVVGSTSRPEAPRCA